MVIIHGSKSNLCKMSKMSVSPITTVLVLVSNLHYDAKEKIHWGTIPS